MEWSKIGSYHVKCGHQGPRAMERDVWKDKHGSMCAEDPAPLEAPLLMRMPLNPQLQ